MINKPLTRDDGFIFTHGAWRSPEAAVRIPEAQRRYNQAKKAKAKEKRRAWIEANGPCVRCGSWERLQVDHIDPRSKEIEIVYVWSASQEKRERELAKCQILCFPCHCQKNWEDIRAGITRHPSPRTTVCHKGHPRTEENTYWFKGYAQCRPCARERERKSYIPKPPRTACRRGHEYTPENTYVDPKGRRTCRTCSRTAARIWERLERDRKRGDLVSVISARPQHETGAENETRHASN